MPSKHRPIKERQPGGSVDLTELAVSSQDSDNESTAFTPSEMDLLHPDFMRSSGESFYLLSN